jgi:hypothetical protein
MEFRSTEKVDKIPDLLQAFFEHVLYDEETRLRQRRSDNLGLVDGCTRGVTEAVFRVLRYIRVIGRPQATLMEAAPATEFWPIAQLTGL